MLDTNAQVIFLLTYQFMREGEKPLTAQEFSQLSRKIMQAGLEGPQSLLKMSSDEIAMIPDIGPAMAKRIRNLLNQGGAASLYLERYLNQDIKIMTRTDADYPLKFKTNLSDFAPPYICYVGNRELLYDLDSTYIISASDAMRIPLPEIFSDIQNMVFILDSLQAVNQLGKSELYWSKCVIISSLGLAKLIHYPFLRDQIKSGNCLILSTNTLEGTIPNFPSLYLCSMALAISSQSVVCIYEKNIQILHNFEQIFNNAYYQSLIQVTRIPATCKNIFFYGIKYMKKVNNSNNQLSSSRTVYTIGHSNHTIEKFLELLKKHNIQILVDIRSVPNSSYSPQFNKDELKNALQEKGIEYQYLGLSLGGRPLNKKVLNSEGKIIREFIEQEDRYQKGIEELLSLTANNKKVAVMCSEEDPHHCHRGYIVTNTLLEKGVQVLHIRGDGEINDFGLFNSPSDQMEIPL